MEASSTLAPAASPATTTPRPTPPYSPKAAPPVFLLGARPLSLDGHVFSQATDHGGMSRFRVDCPTANYSADFHDLDGNAECRRADLFPAVVSHDMGRYYTDNIWGGTFTPAAAPATTWRCELPHHFMYQLADATEGFRDGNCSHWASATGPSGASAATTASTLDRCDMLRGRVPLGYTGAGLEGSGRNFPGVWDDLRYPMNPYPFNSWMVEVLSSLGCPDPTGLVGFALAPPPPPPPTGTGSASGTGSTSAASAGVESGGGRAGPGVLICVALACASMVWPDDVAGSSIEQESVDHAQ
ncbi:hypothetical protein KVR01_011287 [Diaporthe batatas]|uniref:uncharacterized protein n=1 Tax=Diaporthe batatas TaxID=748121 RepID=UPI001D04B2AF|nr:uncharacterized protein KVR01_011287 [Diaporthe batatas]KAG8158844.1 hypothetical protein KVR01_011287 [Diaporthe batatas]